MNTSEAIVREHNIQCPDPETFRASFHYSLDSLSALDATEDRHFWSVAKRRLVAHVLHSFQPRQAFSLLDIGCGNGSLLQYIEHAFPCASVAGMDGYLEALLHCRKRSVTAKLYLHDVTNLNNCAIDQTFDVLTLLDVLEHLDRPDAVLHAAQSLIAPHGIIIATVPAMQSLWSDRDVFLGHRKRYNKMEFTALFANAGYRILYRNYAYSYLFPPAYVYRKWIAPLRRMDGASIEESELQIVPGINGILRTVGSIEVALTRHLPIPFGTSVYVVAQKV